MDKQQSNEEVISGYVDHIVFRNNDNGYTVMVMICDEEELTCVGIFSDIAEGECIEAHGEYTDHPTYGRQFAVKRMNLRSSVISDPVQSSDSVSLWLQELSGDSRKIRSASLRKSRSGSRKSRESVSGKRWRSRIRSMRSEICARR